VLLDVNVTLPPAQNVVGPPAVIIGVSGIRFTVTEIGSDAELTHPRAFKVDV
jgi:hypothetical protein